ncbi:MAG: hypothetical protein H6726_24245 [Sandaracinaceae bacterium]|nr:hypothetical protein [Sandaracinaceae bacterium]
MSHRVRASVDLRRCLAAASGPVSFEVAFVIESDGTAQLVAIESRRWAGTARCVGAAFRAMRFPALPEGHTALVRMPITS